MKKILLGKNIKVVRSSEELEEIRNGKFKLSIINRDVKGTLNSIKSVLL